MILVVLLTPSAYDQPRGEGRWPNRGAPANRDASANAPVLLIARDLGSWRAWPGVDTSKAFQRTRISYSRSPVRVPFPVPSHSASGKSYVQSCPRFSSPPVPSFLDCSIVNIPLVAAPRSQGTESGPWAPLYQDPAMKHAEALI